MVTIRLAEADDYLEIVRGARAFIQQAGLERLMGNGIESAIATLTGLDAVRVYLAETDRIVGGFGVSIMPYIWDMSKTEMSELFFWVYPDAPRTVALALLRRVVGDAEKEGVDIATLVRLSTSPKKLGRIYERLGFTPIQETYVREF